MIDAACAELAPLLSTKTACGLLGKSRATLYRQRNPAPPAERPARLIRPAHPAELGEAERADLLVVFNSERFVDRSPTQVWAILLDEGVYLASVSTMYRLLAAHRQVRERRAQATHPANSTFALLGLVRRPGVTAGCDAGSRVRRVVLIFGVVGGASDLDVQSRSPIQRLPLLIVTEISLG